MTAADWLIVAFVLGVMTWGVLASRRYSKSVADFLAAGRTAGRYVLTVSQFGKPEDPRPWETVMQDLGLTWEDLGVAPPE